MLQCIVKIDSVLAERVEKEEVDRWVKNAAVAGCSALNEHLLPPPQPYYLALPPA